MAYISVCQFIFVEVLERIFKVNTEWIVNEVGFRRGCERKVSKINISLMCFQKPRLISLIVTGGFSSKQNAVHDHSE